MSPLPSWMPTSIRHLTIGMLCIASAACSLNYYSADPEPGLSKPIPGMHRNRTSGNLVVSNILEPDAAALAACDCQPRDPTKAQTYLIDARYKDPQVKRYIDLEPTEKLAIIPYVIPLMKPKTKTLRGTDIYVGLYGTRKDHQVSFSVPVYAAKFPLLRLELNYLQTSFFLMEEEPKGDADGWPSGRYGWIKLLYPPLVASQKNGCATAPTFELSPYKAAVSYTGSARPFTDGFLDKAREDYLTHPRYRLHIDTSQLDLCLTPVPPKETADQG